ncbi:IS21 family transposase [Rhizobium sp. YK2]|uniref:IS21 family transposase n=1 Tax=Rhizobium sp. YK2 TaxID=1860096 RepID=UPI00084C3743|nr:IS21 family transposase [Rhizobium sp. YK2]OEC99674.1 integrase [Rhizobium sp. YK2]
MPRRKQARRTTVRDIRTILRLTHEEGLSVREIAERLKIGKSSVSTYLLRARESGLSWPLPIGSDEDAKLERRLFGRAGRPPRDLSEPDWALVVRELKRKGVTLTLLWQEYRASHPDGYGFTWFCEKVATFRQRASVAFRNRHAAGAVMQTDYAGPTVPVIDPATGIIHPAQIFVAVLGASNLTFAHASFSQQLPDWIDGQVRALTFYGGVTKAIVCDNLKSGVAKALWFEPTLTATFAAMAEHYDTTILPTRSRKPRDKGRVEGAVLIVERWILARLRNRTFFSLAVLNTAIADLLEDLNNRPMRHVGKSRRELFEEIERAALKPLPVMPFEYAEWKSAKVHPDYHVEVDKTFYSVPHRLIGCTLQVRLTHRVVEIFHDHQRVASHVRRSQRSGHVTVNNHMPKAHQRYANTTPANLIGRATQIGPNAAILVERMMRDRPHPEQGYRSAMGILSLAPRYGSQRLDAACERALTINAITYSSVASILKSGLDRERPQAEHAAPTPAHTNIRGRSYYQ